VDPDFHFDAATFCDLAGTAVEEIQSAGRIPLFTGGTGLYLEAFFRGLSPVPDVDPTVREILMKEIEERGSAALHTELAEVDPVSAERIHPNDRQRIIRALQVFRGTGLPFSYYKDKRKGRLSSRTLGIGLSMDKHALDGRIEKRVDGMMRAGFLDEVVSLREKGYATQYNSMRSIGYFELSEYLDGRYGLDEAVERIKRETKEYARKQFAWFRRDPLLKWFDFDDDDSIIEAVSVWLENGDG
jgi:tRNA dimethylallyltransferase